MEQVGGMQRTVAKMVDELFSRRWPDGYKFATAEVAEYVSASTGRDIDRQYIYRIRTGKVQKVDARVLAAIGAFFGQPPSYFSPVGLETDAELEAALVEGEIQIAGMRSKDLSPAARQEVLRLVKSLTDVVQKGTADPTE